MSKKFRPPNQPIDVFKFIDMDGKTDDECWPWTGGVVGKDSRPYFSIDGKKYLAYRIVFELMNNHVLQSGEMVRHRCDNKSCCNPKHLVLGSHQQNMDDMKERERHGLPHTVVRHIKAMILNGIPYRVIGEQYGVSKSLISEIANGRVYAHVKLEDKRMRDPLHHNPLGEKDE